MLRNLAPLFIWNTSELAFGVDPSSDIPTPKPLSLVVSGCTSTAPRPPPSTTIPLPTLIGHCSLYDPEAIAIILWPLLNTVSAACLIVFHAVAGVLPSFVSSPCGDTK